MWRSFRKQTLASGAQPLFGDKLTAAMAIPPSGVNPTIVVADTSLYLVGDRIYIEPGTANIDDVLVAQIVDSTHLVVNSQGAPYHAHANGAVLQLAISVTEILVSGNSSDLYLGTDSSVTNSGGGNVIVKVTSGTPFRETYSANWNTVMTCDLWMAGSLSDSVIAAAQVI